VPLGVTGEVAEEFGYVVPVSARFVVELDQDDAVVGGFDEPSRSGQCWLNARRCHGRSMGASGIE
jgi:hypothetical protein